MLTPTRGHGGGGYAAKPNAEPAAESHCGTSSTKIKKWLNKMLSIAVNLFMAYAAASAVYLTLSIFEKL